MVSILLAVTIASVYTSSQVTSAALIFLAANPQHIEELREEVFRDTQGEENNDALVELQA